MKLLDHLPIERKLLAITLALCGTVSLTALLAYVSFEVWSFRSSFRRDTATLAAILARNSTAALAFEDRAAANEILSSLRAKPTILSASLVNARRVVVAHYGREESLPELASFPAPGQFRFRRGHLLYTEAVQLDGRRLGLFFLRTAFQSELVQLLRWDGLILVGVLTGSAFLAFVLSRRLSQVVITPVLSLAETARTVGENNDYSVRSTVSGRGDELGMLARAFNQMLSQIQQQEAALSLSQQKIQSLVHSIDGIVWEWDLRTRTFTFVSQQSGRVLGYPAEYWFGRPRFWDDITVADDLTSCTQSRTEAQVRRGSYRCEYRVLAHDKRLLWIRESGAVLLENERPVALRGILQDITEQKLAAEQLEKLHSQLMAISRQAGMAEVATDVLHNVGNVLNSINVSASLIRDRLRRSSVHTLSKVGALLQQNASHLDTFLTSDPKGKLVPNCVMELSQLLQQELAELREEHEEVVKSVEHVKAIVAMQQSYARVSGVNEKVSIVELIEDTLRMNEASLTRRRIRIERQFERVPPIVVDKHKVLQILVNLLQNAKHALEVSSQAEKRLTLRVELAAGPRVRVTIADNGIGIDPEHLPRIFSHGFTTRKDGHGFGLHSGANAAKEMGGSLNATSDGRDQGATFVLELPVDQASASSTENGTSQPATRRRAGAAAETLALGVVPS